MFASKEIASKAHNAVQSVAMLARTCAPGRARGTVQTGEPLPMHISSMALMLNVLASAGFGYIFWILAARLYVPQQVGLASGALAAMTLCGQVALLGTGAAVVTLLPTHRERAAQLLNVTFTLVLSLGLVASMLFLLLASATFKELGVVSTDMLYGIAFVAMGVSWSFSLTLDQVSLALRRTDQILVRGVISGVIKLVALVALYVLHGGSIAIFSTWLASTTIACAIGCKQIKAALPGFGFRLTLHIATVRKLLAAGLPNYGLSLALLSPALILPLVVTETLSPEMNAYWYAAWMVAGLVFIVPSSNGMALFSEAANRRASLPAGIISSIKMSLVIGAPMAAVVAIASRWVLPLLGQTYAEVGSSVLPVLLLAVIPMSFIETYVAACRAIRRRGEAALACAACAVLVVCGALLGGAAFGLTGVAAAWLAAEMLAGCWSCIRVLQIRRQHMTDAAAVPTSPGQIPAA